MSAGLAGKCVLVTGGSRGIGRAIVELLAAEGADVTFFYRENAQAAQAVVDAVTAAGGKVAAEQLDVRDSEACAAAVERVASRTETIDVLVNNAGAIRDNPLAGFSDADVQDVLDINVKGAINAFTKALAVELAPRKIAVNAVAPGVIETEMSEAVRELAGDEVKARILMKRFGTPEEIARAVWFLASDYASYITGQVLTVDGGFKME
jgi:3-oxoacyl-[acyl-carrier protein] reductase